MMKLTKGPDVKRMKGETPMKEKENRPFKCKHGIHNVFQCAICSREIKERIVPALDLLDPRPVSKKDCDKFLRQAICHVTSNF